MLLCSALRELVGSFVASDVFVAGTPLDLDREVLVVVQRLAYLLVEYARISLTCMRPRVENGTYSGSVVSKEV